MTPQAAILEPIPDHARRLFFDLNPTADPRCYSWCPPMVGNAVDFATLE